MQITAISCGIHELDLEEIDLNGEADGIVATLTETAGLGIDFHEVEEATVIDCGVEAPGSLLVGQLLAEICLGGLGTVTTSLCELAGHLCPRVTVEVEFPAIACLLSQYAGWKISVGDYFAMASGPMRAAYANEDIFDELGYSEESKNAVGVLEASKLPGPEVIEYLCECLRCEYDLLTLLVAPTASIAGSMQVVSRSVETCLHKLHQLDFDVKRIRSAIGSAYLPPIPKAGDDLTAIGRTNDSILFGGQVYLWVEGDDESIEQIGPKVPSSASKDYGEPFKNIFERYNGDFYQIDPLLFSPAVVAFNNIRTGYLSTFGKANEALLAKSFFGN